MKSTLPEEKWPGHFNEKQYDMLAECAQAGDFKKWNSYRKSNAKESILLEGADLTTLNLSKMNLRKSLLARANLSSSKLIKTIFMAADLTEAVLDGSTLDGTDFVSAKLPNARLTSTIGKNVKFRFADLSGVAFHEAKFDNTNFDRANLTRAIFQASIIRDSNLSHTNMRGARMVDAQIQGSKFCVGIVDGETLIWNCAVDEDTDFTGIGLDSARIEPQLASRLETNIRRVWWHQWYANNQTKALKEWNQFKKSPFKNILNPFRILSIFITLMVVRAFWWSTDYGSSTLRILGTFAGTCILFAALYTAFPNLTGDIILTSPSKAIGAKIVRALYFSIVTTTTVGFGDICANKEDIIGQIIVMVQMMLGYTLLAALVVRMGILFSTMPPCECKPRENDQTLPLDAFKTK